MDFFFNALIFIGWGGAVWECLEVDLDCFSNCANKSLPTFNSTFLLFISREKIKSRPPEYLRGVTDDDHDHDHDHDDNSDDDCA